MWSKRKDDNLVVELERNKRIDVNVYYVEDPAEVPNELLTGEVADPFFEKMPAIAGGTMTLKE